jgi:hypothetical protein
MPRRPAYQLAQKEAPQSFTDNLKQLTEYNLCRESPAYFISTFLQVFEPRTEYGAGWKPFALWPRQSDYLETLEKNYRNGDGMTVEKCRDVGATWLTLAWIFHHWLFIPGFTALVGSRKKDEVQKSDDINPLLSRLNAFYNQLPKWLCPVGFDEKEHSMAMVLHNPANGNTITGESCNPGFGRSKRASVVFLDEYAFWPFDVSGSVRHVSSCVIKVSTVNGRNHFYRSAQQDRVKDKEKSYPDGSGCWFIFEWDQCLNHDQEWYDKQQKESDPVDFAREVLRDYNSSVRGLIYPGIRDCPIGNYKYNPDWPLYICWDYGIADFTVLLFIQRNPETGELYLIDEIARNGEDIEWFVPFVPGKRVKGANNYFYTEYEQSRIDAHARWLGDVAHFGDATGDQRNVNAKGTTFGTLKQYGINFRTNYARWQKMDVRVNMARHALKKLHIDTKCVYFWESFTQYHTPDKRVDSQATSEPKKFVHAFSHAPSAFEAFAICEPPLMSQYKEAGPGWLANPWSFKKVG